MKKISDFISIFTSGPLCKGTVIVTEWRFVVMMKQISFFLFFLLSCVVLHAEEKPSIIPLPADYQSKGTFFHLDPSVTIYHNDRLLADEALFLQQHLFEAKSMILPVLHDLKGRSIGLILQPQAPTDESYRIRMSEDQIIIEAPSQEGIFYGIISLIQLMKFAPAGEIPCWDISDHPEYAWRGLMLDESRHFFGKEKVKFLLDWMAFYKLNRFHWHVTDDPGWRVEIRQYPLLALIGGIGNHTDHAAPPRYYTHRDIKEIVHYAKERKIEIIPEIDMPGHARAANRAYPAFSGGGSAQHPDFTFNPGSESTYQYLTEILQEIDLLFPSQMIHLGGDEVHFGNSEWSQLEGVKRLMEAHHLTLPDQVEKYFMVRMADSLYAMGNQFLAWDEMADIDLPADQTIIFWWRHDKPEYLEKALEREYPVVLCPRIPFYFDFVQHELHRAGRKWDGAYCDLSRVYSFSADSFRRKRTDHILGIQANIWTETIETPERLDFMLFPRIGALAEAAWGTNDDYFDFQERLKGHLGLYQKQGIHYFNPFSPEESKEIIP